jgi:protein arginine N-methyltransferase 5
MMSAVNILSGEGGGIAGRCGDRVQQCWQFEHPRRDLILDPLGESSICFHQQTLADEAAGAPVTNSHTTRSSTNTFSIPHAGQLHGLAGYFECHLYSNIGLSIHPENMHRVSPEMFSWFPIFFPFKQPIYLPGGSELEINIWRLTSKTKIWYEWCCEVYLPTSPPIGGGGGVNMVGSPQTPGLGRSASASMSGSTAGVGGGQPSPMMDAPFSPGYQQGMGSGGEGRIKVAQSTLHNAGGQQSWVGL